MAINTTAIHLGTDLLQTITVDTLPFGKGYVIPLILLGLTLLAITRDYKRYAQLSLPVMMCWHIAGIPSSAIIYIVASITWLIDATSIHQVALLTVKKISTVGIGEAIHAVKQRVRLSDKQKVSRQIGLGVMKQKQPKVSMISPEMQKSYLKSLTKKQGKKATQVGKKGPTSPRKPSKELLERLRKLRELQRGRK